MTDDEIRHRLMAVLHSHRGLRGDDDLVRTLLPAVQAIADEARAEVATKVEELAERWYRDGTNADMAVEVRHALGDAEWARCPFCRAMNPPTAWACDRCGNGIADEDGDQ